ncbi:terpenoid synthase [Hypoxylon fragiforme]|uniref:terpenoid synthase n=1 Tax=Hypoxylon fragiforme TaxID=63214 RepID=UPI0020C613EB|nr:terpenoid synthase [Hypoxylon fragiforme]KAI2605765.1 terpenoid synthase [Hypoxylon fragiforme]
MAITIQEGPVMETATLVVPTKATVHEKLHWPQGVHPEIEKLDEYVQETILSILSSSGNENRLRSTRACNFALFGASWWPFASYDALRICTCPFIWLFVWDDETDSLEFSTISDDWNRASTFRQRTVDYLRESLSGASQMSLSEITTDPLIAGFKPVAEAISRACNDRTIPSLFSNPSTFLAARLCTSGYTCIDHAVNIIRSSIERFEAAEKQLLERSSSTPKIREDLGKFIDGCKYACISNLNWR